MSFVKLINSNQVEYASKSIIVADKRIYNPTEEMLKENGYKELIASEAPSDYYDCLYVDDGDVIRQVWKEWDDDKKNVAYPSVVSNLVAERYSISDELAILRQRDTKPNEFAQYNDFVERCKISASLMLGIDRANEDINYYSDTEALDELLEAINDG